MSRNRHRPNSYVWLSYLRSRAKTEEMACLAPLTLAWVQERHEQNLPGITSEGGAIHTLLGILLVLWMERGRQCQSKRVSSSKQPWTMTMEVDHNVWVRGGSVWCNSPSKHVMKRDEGYLLSSGVVLWEMRVANTNSSSSPSTSGDLADIQSSWRGSTHVNFASFHLGAVN